MTRDNPAPAVWLSVKITARCMMEISPDEDGWCREHMFDGDIE